MSNSLQASRIRRQSAPGSIGLALVLMFYLGSQMVVDQLGPDSSDWAGPRQTSQSFRLPTHPDFLLTLRLADASREPTAVKAGS